MGMGERQLISKIGTDEAVIDLGTYPTTVVEVRVSTDAGPIIFEVYNSIDGTNWIKANEIEANPDGSGSYFNAFRYIKVTAVGGTGNSITIAGAN